MAIETIVGPCRSPNIVLSGDVDTDDAKFQYRAVGYSRLTGTIQYADVGDIVAGYPRIVQFGLVGGVETSITTVLSPDTPGGGVFTLDLKLYLPYFRIELEP